MAAMPLLLHPAEEHTIAERDAERLPAYLPLG